MNRIGRTSLAGALLMLAAVAVWMSQSAAQAATNDTITLVNPQPNTTIAESDDYATQVLNDPWNMDSLDDLDQPFKYTGYGVNNGIWSATTTGAGPTAWLQYQNFTNAYSYLGENDGVNHPVDANRFKNLTFRMYVPQAGNTLLWYFKHYTYAPAGNSNFIPTQAGWGIYSMDLTLGGNGGNGNWTGNGPYEGLRLDPPNTMPAGSAVQFDWARLTPLTGAPVRITWTYTGGGTVKLYLSYSPTANDDNEYLIASVPAGNQAYTWESTVVAPGSYYIHAELNGAWSSIGPLIVNQAPSVRIDAPGPLSGEEYAYAVKFAGWDGNNPAQFEAVNSVSGLTFAPDAIRGTPTNGDPGLSWLFLDNANAIDANKYHYFNVKFWLNPPASRPFSPYNAGTRLIWGSGNNFKTTEMILAPYNRWIPAAYDLRDIQQANGSASDWSGTKTNFRFDPLEEDDAFGQPRALPTGFMIQAAHLTADPVAGRMGGTSSGLYGTFIRWTPLLGNGTLTLYRENAGQAKGESPEAVVIASGLPISQGSYLWDTANVPAGTYQVYADVTDGRNTTRANALAPIVVNNSQLAVLFNDAPQNLWATEYINRLARLNIINGTAQADTTVLFKPNNTATRAQLSKMVVLAAGWALSNPSTATFADVPYGSTFYQYVETAAAHGVSSGYACGSGASEPCPGRYFRPGFNVTRAQTAKMVSVSRGWSIISPTNYTFADVPYDSTPGSLYSYIETMVSKGVINGYPCGGAGEPCDGASRPYFRPSNNVTRAQLSKMISLALDTP